MTQMTVLVKDILAAAGKSSWDPTKCRLVYNKKPVDLNGPWRFANIPAGSKLDLEYSGPREGPDLFAHTRKAEEHAGQGVRVGGPPPPDPGLPPPAAAGAVQRPAAPVHATQPVAPSPHRPPAAPVVPAAPDAVPLPPPESREVFIYPRSELSTHLPAPTAAAGGGPVEDDSFFDLTPEDFARMHAEHQRWLKEQEAGQTLRTRAMREQEERRKAERLGLVRVRVQLPEGDLLLQATFRATEPLSALSRLLDARLDPGIRSRYFLFTTPPRRVLEDLTPTFYQAGLAPAANVHLGVRGEIPASGVLSPESRALVGVLPPDLLGEGVPGARADEPLELPTRFRAFAPPQPVWVRTNWERDEPETGEQATEKKKPKWLKM